MSQVSPQPKLSAAGRLALRKAITNDTGWTSSFRNKHSLSLSTMTASDYFKACELLSIDAAAILRDVSSVAAAQARKAFDDAAPDVVDVIKNDRERDIEVKELPQEWIDAANREAVKKYARSEKSFENRDRMEAEYQANADRLCDAVDNLPSDFDRAITQAAAKAAFSKSGVSSVSDRPEPVGAAGKLAALIAELSATTVDEAQVIEIVERIVSRELEKHAGPVVRIEVTESGLPMGKIDGHSHPEFAKLLRAATARGVDGFSPNVWIAGPAGSGKTYAVGQVARALELDFHFNGAISMPHELLGFVDAGGTYHPTAFRRAYEFGGCYLFDEVDGSDNAALLALNAALANGQATFPDGVITRHKDCKIFAAANTWGLGATAEYVGRTKLDAAFLSRFPVRISWGYDEVLERAICGDEKFAGMVQRARQAAHNLGLKVLITPRDSAAGAALVAAGFTYREAAEMTFLANLTAEQRSNLERQLNQGR